nr:zinc dependent phospholipase C family protein [uncultured Pseudodesulfovibrio sp.]
MVNQIKTPDALDSIQGFTGPMKFAVTLWLKFLELGAVGPDYPYLSVLHHDAQHWADAMHHNRVGDRLKAGIEFVRGLTGPARDKSFVWLLGFASHIATDVTIHPVVTEKVGEYEENKADHRTCEMHQDVHIFQQMQFGPISQAELIRTRIGACNAPGGDGTLDPDVLSTWENMMTSVSDPAERKEHPLDVNGWHRNFKSILDKAEETSRLPALARHVLDGLGIVYPRVDEVKQTYIKALKVPGGGVMHYDEIFQKALHNVRALWSVVGRGCFGIDDEYERAIYNWDLDSGKRTEDGQLQYWSV